MPILQEAISKEDYDRLIEMTKAYMEANTIPTWCGSLGCLFPLICCYIYTQ